LPTGNDSQVDYLSTLPTNTFSKWWVEIYRRISNSLANKRYLSDKTTYPYARSIKIGTSGNWFFSNRSFNWWHYYNTNNIIVSFNLDISTADTIVLSDGTITSYGFYIF
jgi:hypothetical protein